jgi:GT2 family glycosyltransferase
MPDSPAITIALGSYNRLSYLKATIRNLRENGILVPYEITVVDGGSTDGSVKWLASQKDILTIVQHNHGDWNGRPVVRQSWGYFMNIAFKAAHGKYILMISDDCLLLPRSVMNGYRQFEEMIDQGKKVGGLAFYWRNWPDDEKYWITQLFDPLLTMVNHGMFLRKAVEEVGWIEEDAYMFYCADGDLALKLWKAGYSIEVCNTAFVEHHAHANMTVRNKNAHYIKSDFDSFNKNWEGIFYRKGGVEGILQYIDHHDPNKTYRQFPKPPLVKRIKGNLKKIFFSWKRAG